MRKFRNATVAATAAIAITLSGASIASAQEPNDGNNFSDENYSYLEDGSAAAESLSSGGSSQAGDDTEGDTPATGVDLLGSEKNADQPVWAKLFRDTALLAVIGTGIGALIAAYNWAAYNGLVPTF